LLIRALIAADEAVVAIDNYNEDAGPTMVTAVSSVAWPVDMEGR